MAVFGMGCFWGAERKFWTLKDVYSTQVGYAGGYTPNPTYKEVCSGRKTLDLSLLAGDRIFKTEINFLCVFFSFLLPISRNIVADLSLYIFRKQ